MTQSGPSRLFTEQSIHCHWFSSWKSLVFFHETGRQLLFTLESNTHTHRALGSAGALLTWPTHSDTTVTAEFCQPHTGAPQRFPPLHLQCFPLSHHSGAFSSPRRENYCKWDHGSTATQPCQDCSAVRTSWAGMDVSHFRTVGTQLSWPDVSWFLLDTLPSQT